MATKTARKSNSKTSVAKGVVLPFKTEQEPSESATRTEAVKKKRSYSRRSAADLIADLRTKRNEIAMKMSAKLAGIDAKIERIKARSAKQLAIAELAQVHAEELARQLAAAKSQQRLLRLALKAK